MATTRGFFKYTHQRMIVELNFETRSFKKNFFKDNIAPLVTIIKTTIPVSARTYDAGTFTWEIDATFWPSLSALLRNLDCNLVEKADARPNDIHNVHVDANYAENFHYAQEPVQTTESIESIASKLSTFLGVTITTQELSELKKLYRQKAMELHPDRNPNGAAQMSELNRLWTLYSTGGKVN